MADERAGIICAVRLWQSGAKVLRLEGQTFPSLAGVYLGLDLDTGANGEGLAETAAENHPVAAIQRLQRRRARPQPIPATPAAAAASFAFRTGGDARRDAHALGVDRHGDEARTADLQRLRHAVLKRQSPAIARLSAS